MRALVLLFCLSVRTTLVHGQSSDERRAHLPLCRLQVSITTWGCFIDQLTHRDLGLFIGEDQQLTPLQCILACHEQNYLFAAVQYGSECRCAHSYGKYGQVPDDECHYSCKTSEKCGGDYRNSVYSVIQSIDPIPKGRKPFRYEGNK